MAAAPEMLLELKLILEWHEIEKVPLRENELCSIRAVIAKAQGAA